MLLTAVLGILLAGCAAPISADRASTRQAYAQVEASALRTGKPSAEAVSILHRYGLDEVAARQPDEAVRQIHAKAVATGERNLPFALAEMSYVAGDQIQHSVKPWEPRDARDYYLGSVVYAWLFLFGEGKDASPGPFDRRLRAACDFYNYSLGLALTGRRSTNALVHLKDARRRLPVGEIELRLTKGSEAGNFFSGKMPTSLDGMSPKNPALLAMADILVVPGKTAPSIVAIDGDDQPPKGGDGVVKYVSARVDYVQSEFIVRSFHSCLDQPPRSRKYGAFCTNI